MGAASPQLGALLAKLLVDVGSVFAIGNPQQEALGSILRDRIGGLVRAQTFNRGQSLTQNVQGALREPGVGPGLPATAANIQAGGALVAPGISQGVTTAAGTVTQPPAVAPPAQVDPFQALALGQEGAQDLIRTAQQQRFEVQRGLDRQQDFKKRLDLIQQTQDNRRRFAEFQAEAAEALDIAEGGPEKRAGEAELLQQRLGVGRAEAAGRPTVEQELQSNEAQLKEDLANATTADERARVAGRLADLEVKKAEREGVLSPSELTSTRALAERAMSPIILNTLVERLGKTDELDKIITTFNDPSTLLDETVRRTNFISMINLLTPNEKRDLEKQFGVSLTEIAAGRQPFGEVGLGRILGAPSATNPAIDPIGEASVLDAVTRARDPNSLLRRSGR